jgi:hypothetical protein
MIAFADSLLIWLYRITGDPILDYFLGTFLLSFLAVVVGEFTISLVFKANKSHLDRLNNEMQKMSRLSMEAQRLGDESGYRACNKEGNEAFGRLFFNRFGLAAASLWPIFLALAWMQTRFHGIDFPVAWPLSVVARDGVGYAFTFIPLYILCRILFKYMRPWLPYFRGVQKRLDASK